MANGSSPAYFDNGPTRRSNNEPPLQVVLSPLNQRVVTGAKLALTPGISSFDSPPDPLEEQRQRLISELSRVEAQQTTRAAGPFPVAPRTFQGSSPRRPFPGAPIQTISNGQGINAYGYARHRQLSSAQSNHPVIAEDLATPTPMTWRSCSFASDMSVPSPWMPLTPPTNDFAQPGQWDQSTVYTSAANFRGNQGFHPFQGDDSGKWTRPGRDHFPEQGSSAIHHARSSPELNLSRAIPDSLWSEFDKVNKQD